MTEKTEERPITWVPIEEILEVIKLSRENKWHWPLNWDCKYLNLRVDMRDGHCVIRDRHDKLLTLEDLKRQDS